MPDNNVDAQNGPERHRGHEGGTVKIHISYEKDAQGALVLRLLRPVLNLPEARIKEKKDTLRGRKHVYITI